MTTSPATAGHETPSCHDSVTMACPVCQGSFTPVGRQRYCSVLLGCGGKRLLRRPFVCDRRS